MDFTKLGQYLDTLHDVHVPGCDIVVYADHEPVYRHMAGYRDPAEKQPINGNETYCLYSCTKVFTTCAVMQLLEKEKLSLDDAVSAYLPAYKNLTVLKDGEVVPAERTMTIRHLLSMQSGLDYELDTPAIRRVLEQTGGQASTRQIVDVLPESPLQFEPGTNFLYSLSHDVLAAVIEVVSGQKFSDYLKENIFDPLGLSVIGFTLKEEDRRNLCAQYEHDPESDTLKLLTDDVIGYRISRNYESGGAGLISNVHDYAVFSDTLACGGKTKDGVQILSPEMIQLWRANQLSAKARRTFDEWNRLGYSYALGVRTRVDLSKGGLGSIGEFGWDGAACAWTMIDPTLRLSAFFAMHVKNFGYGYDVIHPQIRNLIYEGFTK